MKQRILIVTPAPRGSRKGNRITALRWAQILRQLEYSVQISEDYRGQQVHILVALHARKSAAAISRFRSEYPTRPLLVTLTGTDLYHDLEFSAAAKRSLELASRLIVLQPEALGALPPRHRRKVHVIIQSATPPDRIPPPSNDAFEICVVGHLRPVKDPFRAAMAARLLSRSSQVRIVQIGKALTPDMEQRAKRELKRNSRYLWLEELSHKQTLRRIAQCRAIVLSSRLEGGANVISEAIVSGVPVLASRIAGSIGLLGKKYPGYFEPGDTRGLAKLLHRVESEPRFLNELKTACQRLHPRFTPQQEMASWRKLLAELDASFG